MSEDKIYLTTGPDPKGRGLLAIMSLGSPQLGDKTTVLTLEIVEDQDAAHEWFARMKVQRPWVSA